MAWSPYGWVEVRIAQPAFRETLASWHPAVLAQTFIETEAWKYPYKEGEFSIFQDVFGVVSPGTFPHEVQPIAAQRGSPEDASYWVKVEQKEPGGAEFSWVMWSELKVFEERLLTRDVRTLFSFMEILAANYGEDNVRLIFWILR